MAGRLGCATSADFWQVAPTSSFYQKSSIAGESAGRLSPQRSESRRPRHTFAIEKNVLMLAQEAAAFRPQIRALSGGRTGACGTFGGMKKASPRTTR